MFDVDEVVVVVNVAEVSLIYVGNLIVKDVINAVELAISRRSSVACLFADDEASSSKTSVLLTT